MLLCLKYYKNNDWAVETYSLDELKINTILWRLYSH